MQPIIPVLFFFLNTSQPLQSYEYITKRDSNYKIYLVKQRWHTGIVFKREEIDTTIWKDIHAFKNFNYVDVGWGDEEFYQYPDFDFELAVKALFYPTNSTLRIEGINISIDEYASFSDIAIELSISSDGLEKIYKFIDSTYQRDENGKSILLSERYNGYIKFYKAKGEYHLFNTCNTWVAEALNYGGIKIPTDVVLAEQLFNEALDFGKIIKAEER